MGLLVVILIWVIMKDTSSIYASPIRCICSPGGVIIWKQAYFSTMTKELGLTLPFRSLERYIFLGPPLILYTVILSYRLKQKLHTRFSAYTLYVLSTVVTVIAVDLETLHHLQATYDSGRITLL